MEEAEVGRGSRGEEVAGLTRQAHPHGYKVTRGKWQ